MVKADTARWVLASWLMGISGCSSPPQVIDATPVGTYVEVQLHQAYFEVDDRSTASLGAVAGPVPYDPSGARPAVGECAWSVMRPTPTLGFFDGEVQVSIDELGVFRIRQAVDGSLYVVDPLPDAPFLEPGMHVSAAHRDAAAETDAPPLPQLGEPVQGTAVDLTAETQVGWVPQDQEEIELEVVYADAADRFLALQRCVSPDGGAFAFGPYHPEAPGTPARIRLFVRYGGAGSVVVEATQIDLFTRQIFVRDLGVQ